MGHMAGCSSLLGRNQAPTIVSYMDAILGAILSRRRSCTDIGDELTTCTVLLCRNGGGALCVHL